MIVSPSPIEFGKGCATDDSSIAPEIHSTERRALTRLQRDEGWLSGSLPLTAEGAAEKRRRLLESGFDPLGQTRVGALTLPTHVNGVTNGDYGQHSDRHGAENAVKLCEPSNVTRHKYRSQRQESQERCSGVEGQE